LKSILFIFQIKAVWITRFVIILIVLELFWYYELEEK